MADREIVAGMDLLQSDLVMTQISVNDITSELRDMINDIQNKMNLTGLNIQTECKRCGAALEKPICLYCATPIMI